jgi:hypothetical protein
VTDRDPQSGGGHFLKQKRDISMMRFAKLFLVYAMVGLWLTHARAQGTNSTDWFISPVGFRALMSNRAVLAELHPSDDQAKALETLRQEVSDKQVAMARQENLQRPEGQREATPKGLERANALIVDWQKNVAKVLEHEQLLRLREIQIQYVGAIGFTTTQVQTALSLTDDQKKQAQKIVDELSSKLRDLAMADGGDRETWRRKSSELHIQAFDKAHSLLTEPQKTSWKTLIGKPFIKPFEEPKQ